MSRNVKQSSVDSVAIVTATIGKPELERAIKSVQAQTYPCRHYVFVDGEQFWAEAKAILSRYPNVIATYLPMNTGRLSWKNSCINAIAPFMVEEDYLAFLDDDNWFEPNHIETVMACLKTHRSDYVYSLRNFVDLNGDFVCRDTIESIGHFSHKVPEKLYVPLLCNGVEIPITVTTPQYSLIDVGCYFLPKSVAISVAQAWYEGGEKNDANVFRELNQRGMIGKCSGLYTLNYVAIKEESFSSSVAMALQKLGMNVDDIHQVFREISMLQYRKNFELYNGHFPWE
ncbi:hypothetical protein B0187_00070 [Haemophilus paracuniculus]|uniref:Glycosyltransferase 2-like domain-containing protein n=2 Tax=Haemophilus paracuniculus TaxID=734 RepID=A0A1T0AV18_9PAST|nr:hypothetical protein B0187_00070 [Haemophilus paracuniculus]